MKITRMVFGIILLTLSTAPATAQGRDRGPLGDLLETILLPDSTGAGFGMPVSLSGDTAAIGDSRAYIGPNFNPGTVHVFVGSVGLWGRQVRLDASDGEDDDYFGAALSLSGDTLLIGAHQDDDLCPSNPDCDSGSAYVFVRSGTTWSEENKLTPSDAAQDGLFGGTVSLDGDTAAIACGSWIGGAPAQQAVYVFVRSGTAWSEEAKLIPGDLGSADRFGRALSISGDTLLVGASFGDHGGYTDAGAAYVFTRSGTSWSQQTKLTANDPQNQVYFGISVALDGETAVVGADLDDELALNSGAAYVFVRSGSTWTQQAKLKASDAEEWDIFGNVVSLDGDHALIGTQNADDMSGSVYKFERSGSSWTEQFKLKASNAASNGRYGNSVSIDGETFLVGADWVYPGKAYIYEPPPEFPGVGFCFGDPGSGIPCPCSNDNDGSVPGSGCDNGVFASGAHLSGSGLASVSHDSLVLTTTGLEPSNTGLYIQGDVKVNGGNGTWFGDGLRCAGGAVKRLQVRFCDAAGVSHTTIAIGAEVGVMPGETKYYQCWYRNQSTPACGLGINEYNLSNGYEVLWLP